MTNILITGAYGTLSKYIIKELELRKDVKICGLVRKIRGGVLKV